MNRTTHTAAFTVLVGALLAAPTRSAQRAINSVDTPCPSWPMTQAQGLGKAARCKGWLSCELVATRGTEIASRSATTRPSMRRSPKCAPCPARTTLGDHSAAVPLMASTWRTPKAAALRRMAPTLPASWSRSSTTLAAPASMTGAAGRVSSAPICAGDSSPLRPLNSVAGTTRARGADSASAASGASCMAASVSTTSAGFQPRCNAARNRWSPSIQTLPVLR